MFYHFFLSYAQSNSNAYLKQFFNDLSDTVRQRSNRKAEIAAGYFSQESMPLGGEWDPELLRAMQGSSTMVCLYSPAYFLSENCGREWQFFEMRRRAYVERARANGVTQPRWPAVIKPVIWVPLREDPPASVGGVDLDVGDPNDVHNKVGLLTLTRLSSSSNYSEAYVTFLNKVADEIINESERGPGDELPQLAPAPQSFAAIRPAFPTVGHAEPVATQSGAAPRLVVTRPRAVGPKFVKFVFAVGSPSEFLAGILTGTAKDRSLAEMLGLNPELEKRLREMFERLSGEGREQELVQEAMNDPELGAILSRLECYYDSGGGEWRPYIQDVTERAGPFVKRSALSSGVDIDVGELTFDDNLVEEIRKASDKRNLVIILVDSWTLNLKRYRDILASFDKSMFWNCSVMLPLNRRDPRLHEDPAQADPLLARLKENVLSTFQNWYRSFRPQPLRFCYSIHSATDLESKIRETLLALRDSYVQDILVDERAVIAQRADNSISKSSVTPSNEPATGAQSTQ
jgi:FxsC-like protein